MIDRSRRLGFLWGSLVAIVLLAFISMARDGFQIETDLLELLPKDERNPILTTVTKAFMREVSQRIVLLVGAPEADLAARAADRLEEELRGSGSFSRVIGTIGPDLQKAYEDLYFPYRERLIGDELRDVAREEDAARALAARAERILSSPLGGGVTARLAEDPLLFFPEVLSRLPAPPGGIRVDDGRLALDTDGVTRYLVTAVLAESVFAREAQRQASAALEAAVAATAAGHPDAEISQLGALRFAKRMAEQAERDISIIGIGSMGGTAALVVLTFFSAQPLFFSVLTVLVGVLCAFTVSLLVFPSVHVLTLGFGASLIGVCADYSFHFFCHRFADRGQSSGDTVHAIMPGITIGVATSVLGYLGLLAVPFPGLNQMAIFAVTGMLASYLCVVCWFPLLPPDPREAREPLLLRLSHRWLTFARTGSARRLFAALSIAIAPFAALGLSRVEANDDVRILQKPPADLVAEEKRFRDLLGNADGSRFFAVVADDAEDALRAEERLSGELELLKNEGAVDGYQAVSSLLPSLERQAESLAAVRSALLEHPEETAAVLTGLGFRREDVDRYLDRLDGELPLLGPEAWLASDASLPLRHLWLGEVGGKHVTLVPLHGVHDEARVAKLEDARLGIYHLDLVGDSSALIGRYRHSAAVLIGGCYLAVYILLAVRYGGRLAALGMAPALASLVLNVAFQGLTGQPLTLFSILANAIVLGLAIDYSVFLLEGMDAEGPTMMAIVLSALTTILSFGLLALSSTAVLRSFGTSLFIGVTVAMTLSPLLVRRR